MQFVATGGSGSDLFQSIYGIHSDLYFHRSALSIFEDPVQMATSVIAFRVNMRPWYVPSIHLNIEWLALHGRRWASEGFGEGLFSFNLKTQNQA